MSPTSCRYYKILLNQFNPQARESYLKCLPKETANKILQDPIEVEDVKECFPGLDRDIASIHYSWFIRDLENLPVKIRPLVIEAFPEEYSSRLSQLLRIDVPKKPMARVVKSFFLNYFWKFWFKDRPPVPRVFLSPTPLNVLLNSNKNELVELIDFLALYDLAENLRHVVRKTQLQQIYAHLSAKKQQFLRTCLHQKEKIVSPALDMEHWDGDAKKLDLLLHKRGLFRLSRALVGQAPEFLWYVTHKLDTGRGEILLKSCSSQSNQEVVQVLVQQVLSTVNFLKKKGES